MNSEVHMRKQQKPNPLKEVKNKVNVCDDGAVGFHHQNQAHCLKRTRAETVPSFNAVP